MSRGRTTCWLVLGAAVALGHLGCESRPSPTDRVTPAADAKSVIVQTTAKSAEVPAGPHVYEKVVLSPVYDVDRLYKSMTGPQSTAQVALGEEGPELVWVVGFEATMVEPDGRRRTAQEYMCHTNLDIDVAKHEQIFPSANRLTGRLFTLSQGQYRIDLPKGYGIPLSSEELLSLNTQVLNLNRPDEKFSVRHRVVFRYVRDKELNKPYRAVFSAGAFGLKLLDGKDGHYGHESKTNEHEGHEGHPSSEQGTGCLPGENASTHVFDDSAGRKFTGHWVVKPGKEVNHTTVTRLMDLPYDTTLHYVAVHLHPFAESLELRDLTSKKTIYRAFTRQADKGIGLAHVDFFSSEGGIMLRKDHEYELISAYNNTTLSDQDSMAVMNLYLHDRDFKKPSPAQLAASAKPLPSGSAPRPPGLMAAPPSTASSAHVHH